MNGQAWMGDVNIGHFSKDIRREADEVQRGMSLRGLMPFSFPRSESYDEARLLSCLQNA